MADSAQFTLYCFAQSGNCYKPALALQLAGADWTPLVNEIVQFLPEKYRPLALAAFVFGSGILFEWLRRITTEPLEERKAAAFYSAPRPPGEG